MPRLKTLDQEMTLNTAAIILISVLIAIGFNSANFPIYWNLRILLDVAGWIGCNAIVAYLLQRINSKLALPIYLLAITVYFIIGVGVYESLATTLLVISAYFYGKVFEKLIFPRSKTKQSATYYITIGIIFILVFFGLLINFKVNHKWVYVVFLSIPFCINITKNLEASLEYLKRKNGTFQNYQMPVSQYWVFVSVIILVAAVNRYALFPTIAFDDNVLHLRLWTQLTVNHKYIHDVNAQIWDVAPYVVSLLHSIISLVASSDGRSALNWVLFSSLLRQIWVILALYRIDINDRLLALLLFASTPMLGNLLVGLQTELFLALLVTTGVRLSFEIKGRWQNPNSLGILAVAALCCGTKLPGILIGALIIFGSCLQFWSQRKEIELPKEPLNITVLFIFIGFIIFVAFNSYINAWMITGNPVFPLYNGYFKSSYFDFYSYQDRRYVKGFTVDNYWSVFFRTSEFFESRNFVAGFQYLLLLPIALLVTIRRLRFEKVITLLVPLIGFGTIMFSITQYWRYVFPIFPIAGIAIAFLLINQDGQREKTGVHLARGASLACILLNFFFFPGVSWFFGTEPQRAFTEKGKIEITGQYAPAKLATSIINEKSANARVLYPRETPFGATLHGDPIYVNWYSPKRLNSFRNTKNIENMADFIKYEKVDYVVWDISERVGPQDPEWFLREYLSIKGVPEKQIGNFIVFRLVVRPVLYREVFNLKTFSSEKLSLQIPSSPIVLARIKTEGANIARYRVKFKCQSSEGSFIAQVNWDNGPPYYKPIPCDKEFVNFSEAVPVPNGATAAEIYATVRDSKEAYLSELTLETN